VAQPLVIGNLRLNKVSRTTAVNVQRVSVRGATPPKNLSGTPVLDQRVCALNPGQREASESIAVAITGVGVSR
jgi:hypothetical protein